MSFKIEKYKDEYRNEILSVWEKSVLATHHFLNPKDFGTIKKPLHGMNFTDLNIYCLMDVNKMIGFIGLANTKIEMLFLAPDYIGLGLGKQLMNFAISKLNANLVDVNEQNNSAVLFYKKSGFEVFERTEKDDLGKGYPLLRMKLKKKDSD